MEKYINVLLLEYFAMIVINTILFLTGYFKEEKKISNPSSIVVRNMFEQKGIQIEYEDDRFFYVNENGKQAIYTKEVERKPITAEDYH